MTALKVPVISQPLVQLGPLVMCSIMCGILWVM